MKTIISFITVIRITFLTGLTLLLGFCSFGCLTPDNHALQEPDKLKPRILVTTDIGGDPDDTQSLVRLLVSSSELELEGLVASASGTPGELDTFIVRPDLILALIDRYDTVFENLLLHHPDFPDPAHLRMMVKSGSPRRGMEHIGPGKDTEGSRWIESRILADDPRPLNICIWGGQTDLFQALIRLKLKLGEAEFRELTRQLRVYNINDQDRIHVHFRDTFPDLFHILAKAPEGQDKREGVYRGMYLGGNESLTSKEWVYAHIKSGHGALGSLYPDKTWTAPNPHSCLKEGDTPSWFYFLNPALQDPWEPGFGGWGGRFKKEAGNYYTDDRDRVKGQYSARATVWRWREAFQNDFAARMDWCVLSYPEANHAPELQLKVRGCERLTREKGIWKLQARSGKKIRLNAAGSRDPDGDQLDFRWWIYPEASGLPDDLAIPTIHEAAMDLDPTQLPDSDAVHLILEVRDHGKPALTSYQRIILFPPPAS